MCPSGAEPLEGELELDVGEGRVVGGGRLGWRQGGLDRVDDRRLVEPAHDLAHEPDVGPRVVGRDEPLVAEPDVDASPARLERRRELVGGSRRRAARERDVATASNRLGQALGGEANGIVGDDELDVAHASSSEAPRRACTSKSRTRKRPIVA